VSVDDALTQGRHVSCRACRHALTEADCASSEFVQDVSCPYCADRQTPAQRASFRERARQVRLAAARGQRHVGAAMTQKERT
jgi:UPF0176 protein